jgi:hypothetical protein
MFITGYGKMVKNMVLADTHLQMETFTKANLSKECDLARENILGLTVAFMTANGNQTK